MSDNSNTHTYNVYLPHVPDCYSVKVPADLDLEVMDLAKSIRENSEIQIVLKSNEAFRIFKVSTLHRGVYTFEPNFIGSTARNMNDQKNSIVLSSSGLARVVRANKCYTLICWANTLWRAPHLGARNR